MGATEAINLCLQAVARPGDVIAVETPTFYAMLHAIERMGMKVVEVPTDPELGIDVDMLARLARELPIAARMVMPNFQNPLGFRMPDERKAALVRLATERDMPIIENGVCNELYYGDTPPGTLKAHDTKRAWCCTARPSKTLTSVYRIGWHCRRYRDQVEKLKFLNTLTTPAIPQLAIAEYLERDGYDHRLRRMRKAYAQQAGLIAPRGAPMVLGRHRALEPARRIRIVGGTARADRRHGNLPAGAGARHHRRAGLHVLGSRQLPQFHPAQPQQPLVARGRAGGGHRRQDRRQRPARQTLTARLLCPATQAACAVSWRRMRTGIDLYDGVPDSSSI